MHSNDAAEEVADIVRLDRSPAVDDATLVARVLGGDEEAKSIIFHRYVELVSRTVIRLLRDRTEAEDVVQDTFVRAFTSLRQLRDPRAFRGWLLQIAVRHVHRRFRRQRLRRVLGFDRGDPQVSLAALASRDASPEVRAELALLDRRLDALPPEQRSAWILKRVEGYTLAKVAEICGCSLRTAKRRVRAARSALAPYLEVEDDR